MDEKKIALVIIQLREILDPSTRKIRRSLLATGALLILLITTGLTPKTIFGVEFNLEDKWILLSALAVVVFYHLLAFITDALRDYFLWSRETDREFLKQSSVSDPPSGYNFTFGLGDLRKDEKSVYYIRFFLVMIFPVIIGLVAMLLWIIDLSRFLITRF